MSERFLRLVSGGGVALVLVVLLAVGAGCGKKHLEAEGCAGLERASVEIEPRGWVEEEAYYVDGAVGHPRLYMRGVFEGRGSDDGRFNTWDWGSAASMVASPVIFGVDVVLTPVVAMVAWPWQTEYSRAGLAAVEEGVYELPAEGSGMTKKERHGK